jgi:hypothetical protein
MSEYWDEIRAADPRESRRFESATHEPKEGVEEVKPVFTLPVGDDSMRLDFLPAGCHHFATGCHQSKTSEGVST